jgi:hypothetical protein
MIKPAVLMAKRFTTRDDAPPGDSLESRLHRLELGKRVQPIAPPAPHSKAAITGSATAMESRFQILEAQVAAATAAIASLKEKALDQDNVTTQLRLAMSSTICEVGGERFDSDSRQWPHRTKFISLRCLVAQKLRACQLGFILFQR